MKTIDDSGVVELYGEPRKQAPDISGSFSLEKISSYLLKKVQLTSTGTYT